MCIIGYCPKGKNISDERLKVMFAHNPDGAGVMWKTDKGIQIRKGFMTFKELLEQWHNTPKDCEKAVHCRIASHGAINAANCHPFPVRSDIDKLSKPVDVTNEAVMHNGIIHLTSPKGGTHATYSDTMLYVTNILANLKDVNNKYVQRVIGETTDFSRLLIFKSHCDTVMIGHWVEKDGCYFSNSSFEDYRKYTSCWTPPALKCKRMPDPKPSVFDDYGFDEEDYSEFDNEYNWQLAMYKAGKR